MIRSLPISWRMIKLGDCLIRRKENVLPSTLSDDFIGLVGLEDIQDGGRGGITIRQTKPFEIESLKTRFETGDILYGKLRPYLNKVGIVQESGVCSTEIWAFTTHSILNSHYAAFFLASSFFVDRVESLTKGANLPRLDAKSFDSIDIPVPTLSEQQRIVEILQEAEEIRRLRSEAEAKTAELIPAMFFQHFINGEYNEFIPLNKLAHVVSGVAIGRKTKGMTLEVPYLRVANVQAGYVDLSEVKTTTATEDEVKQFGLKNGDILLTEGGDFDKLGRGCLWEGQVEPCIHQNHVFRVRPFPGKLNSLFFTHYLQSEKAKHYFLRCAKKTTNLASINLTQLNALPVPKISLEAQIRFESEIQMATECSMKNGDRSFTELINSLSAHAFSGQLTADWRETHEKQLAQEARERDVALKETGAIVLTSRITATSATDEFDLELTEGIYADLNREQRSLLAEIGRMVGGVPYARYFTAKKLSDYISQGPLRRNPHAIEGHLAVFAARGLVIPVSREDQPENTGEFVYARAYRRPFRDSKPAKEEAHETESVDFSRSRELERLADHLKKESYRP